MKGKNSDLEGSSKGASMVFAKYLSGVFAAEEFEEKQPTNLGMLVADVVLINSLGLGVMYDLERILLKLTLS